MLHFPQFSGWQRQHLQFAQQDVHAELEKDEQDVHAELEKDVHERTCTQRSDGSRRTCTREGREVLLAFSTCCQGEVLLEFSTCCQGEGCLADTPCEDSGLSRRQSAVHARRVLFKVCSFVCTRCFNFPAVHARRVLFCSFVRARAVLIFC